MSYETGRRRTRRDGSAAGASSGATPGKRTMTDGMRRRGGIADGIYGARTEELQRRSEQVGSLGRDQAASIDEERATLPIGAEAGMGDQTMGFSGTPSSRRAGGERDSDDTLAIDFGGSADSGSSELLRPDDDALGILDERALDRATRRNPRLQQRLGYNPATFSTAPVDSAAFAIDVAELQLRYGLGVDGIVGAETCDAVGVVLPGAGEESSPLIDL